VPGIANGDEFFILPVTARNDTQDLEQALEAGANDYLVIQATEFSLHGSNLRAELDVPPDLWRSAVDPGQIEQVINALIINAREAARRRGPSFGKQYRD